MDKHPIDNAVYGLNRVPITLNEKQASYREMYYFALLQNRRAEVMKMEEYTLRVELASKLKGNSLLTEQECMFLADCVSYIPNLDIVAASNLINMTKILTHPITSASEKSKTEPTPTPASAPPAADEDKN
jgi:hypothetical protein